MIDFIYIRILTKQLIVDEEDTKEIVTYQSSKFSFSCISLVETLSREINKIKLSPSHHRKRGAMHYSPDNEKKSHVP